jgi:hypothetical protein
LKVVTVPLKNLEVKLCIAAGLKTWKNVLFRKENIFFATETDQIAVMELLSYGMKNFMKLFLATFTFKFVVDNRRPSFYLCFCCLTNLGSKLSVRRILSSPPPKVNGTKTEINW